MADDEVDDPVEHEIDVYLSKSLASNLYILQYPLRPAYMTYENVDCISARVKHQQKRVEIELSLNTSSSNYSSSKGEQIAVNVDGGRRQGDEEPYYPGGKMDRQILRSAPCATTTHRYAVGLLKSDELHLTPVHAVVQMRPTFDYLDKADSRHQKSEAANRTGDAGESSQDEGEEEAKPVMVKFAQHESEEAKARRMASYEYIQKQLDDELWCPLAFHNLHDDRVEPELQLLYAVTCDERVQQFHSSTAEYLASLVPPAADDKSNKPAMPDNVLSYTQLRSLPLPDQIRALMTSVKVMRFSQLMELLPKDADAEAALRVLQQVAVMVQGCWVVKSDILYPKDSCSQNSGISFEHLRNGRDFIMWKFTHSKYVVRKEISGLPSEDVKDILEQMSRLRTSHGWEFLYDYDRDFVERHPDVARRQRELWDLRFQQLQKIFKVPHDANKRAREAELVLMNQHAEKPRRRRALSKSSPRKRTLSGRSLSDVSDMETEASTSVLDKRDNPDTASASKEGSYQKGEPMEVCFDSLQSTHTNGPLLNNGHQAVAVGVNSHGDARAQNMDSAVICRDGVLLQKELAAFAQEVLTQKQVLTLKETKRLFFLHLSQCPPGHILASGFSDKMLEAAFVSVGGVKLNNKWPPNSQEDVMFALVNTGDKTDEIRHLLLSMFEQAYRIKSTAFIARLKERYGQEFSDAQGKKLLKDLCEWNGSMWYLKGTVSSSS